MALPSKLLTCGVTSPKAAKWESTQVFRTPELSPTYRHPNSFTMPTSHGCLLVLVGQNNEKLPTAKQQCRSQVQSREQSYTRETRKKPNNKTNPQILSTSCSSPPTSSYLMMVKKKFLLLRPRGSLPPSLLLHPTQSSGQTAAPASLCS